jgi:tetratricopeptide (TPR) repeat protein
MEDLEDERAHGEVDDEDFRLLDARYAARLTEVEASLLDLATTARAEATGTSASAQPTSTVSEAFDELPDGRRTYPQRLRWRRRLGNRRVRRVLVIGAAVCFVMAATLLAASIAGVRLPSESATGSVSLSSAQQEQQTLSSAAILGSEGQIAQAVQLYSEVLRVDPNQPNALTYEGWLVRLAGLSSKNQVVVARGDASVARAVKVAPGYPDAHALMGVILFEDLARPASAVAQFRAALTAGASKSLLASVAAVAEQAFSAAKLALPSKYVAALKSAVG